MRNGFAQLEIAITGCRKRRREADRHERAAAGSRIECPVDDGCERNGVGNVVVGRKDPDRHVGIRRRDLRAAGRDGRGRVAARGLENDPVVRDSGLRVRECGVFSVRGDVDRVDAGNRRQPLDCPLQERLPVEDREELLRARVGGERPEARAGAAREDEDGAIAHDAPSVGPPALRPTAMMLRPERGCELSSARKSGTKKSKMRDCPEGRLFRRRTWELNHHPSFPAWFCYPISSTENPAASSFCASSSRS